MATNGAAGARVRVSPLRTEYQALQLLTTEDKAMNIESIINRHDPEHDASRVSWADATLAEAVVKLIARVEALEEQVIDLKKDLEITEKRLYAINDGGW